MGTEKDTRKDIVEACRQMNANGINQGTSGNISIRYKDRMLISPSAVPYNEMKPSMIASMDLSGQLNESWEGPMKPSTEWRFHWLLMKGRADISAIVHAHPTYCTTLAILRKPIPSCHYMIAVFGGTDVRCADYATFGTLQLADNVLKSMKDRTACLLANHGMVAVGSGIEQAMWRAVELETIARQYYLSLQAGKPHLLTKAAIGKTHQQMASYGVQDKKTKRKAGN